ncbi:tRNA-adenosine deaminase [Okibacterium fritillariae]|uniref:tRNA-specific adenosine deaminase n=2 Tax=Okibacterium fritillariae TaxID=123320 RepID=A0A1T5INT0_9MICO|nr:tRNA-adenosine deaminase [Okibacterium fritillariae]
MPPQVPDHYRRWMLDALALSTRTSESGDVPVGALLFDGDGALIATGINERELLHDPTGHAEIVAMRRAAAARQDWHLADCTLVVTLEPCIMCAGAIVAARVGTVVFGAWDDKAGGAGSVYDILRDRRLNHRVEVYAGVEAEACGRVLTAFFREK